MRISLETAAAGGLPSGGGHCRGGPDPPPVGALQPSRRAEPGVPRSGGRGRAERCGCGRRELTCARPGGPERRCGRLSEGWALLRGSLGL